MWCASADTCEYSQRLLVAVLHVSYHWEYHLFALRLVTMILPACLFCHCLYGIRFNWLPGAFWRLGWSHLHLLTTSNLKRTMATSLVEGLQPTSKSDWRGQRFSKSCFDLRRKRVSMWTTTYLHGYLWDHLPGMKQWQRNSGERTANISRGIDVCILCS